MWKYYKLISLLMLFGIVAMLFSNSHKSFKFVKLQTSYGNFGKFDLIRVNDYNLFNFDKSHLNWGAFKLSPNCTYLSFVKFYSSTISLNLFSPKYKSVSLVICPTPSILYILFLSKLSSHKYLNLAWSDWGIFFQFISTSLYYFMGILKSSCYIML